MALPTPAPEIDCLRCELMTNPLAVDAIRPHLAWVLGAGFRGRRQTAYQVRVAVTPEQLDGGALLWDSGRVASGHAAHVEYGGPPLPSRATAWWTVRAWNEDGEPSRWAAPARWETGLLSPREWEAEWIALGPDPAGPVPPVGVFEDMARDTLPAPPRLRRAFALQAPVRRARLYCTALGLYEAFVNGERVGDGQLEPGWTDYDARVQYQAHDVTELLRVGENAIAAQLADGWYAGYVGFDVRRRGNHWGTRPELLAQLEIETEAGEQVRIVSDASWMGTPSPLRCADLLLGETYAAARDQPGWAEPGFAARGWRPVLARGRDGRRLVGERTPPVRVVGHVPAVDVRRLPDGAALVDFGQNLAGRVRLQVPAGTQGTIRVEHGEVLAPDGDLYVENLRFAQQRDVYELDGAAAERVLEPRFTIHGFRYAKVSGWPGELRPRDATAIALSSLGEQTGEFACSDALVTRLHENIAWTQRSTFVSIPQDDPQRDERLGWIADAALFAPTACRLHDCATFFAKYLVDVEDARTAEGLFANVAPRVVIHDPGAPGWGDGGVMLPWTLYEAYGDRRVLERHYDAMTRWVEWIGEANPDGIRRARLQHNFGDWLVPDGAPACDKVLFATLIYAHVAGLLSKTAAVLGRQDDAQRFVRLREDIRCAFEASFVEDGRIADPSQTARVLAVAFELLDEPATERALDELVADLEARAWTPGTGMHGTAFLCPVLSRHGRLEAAYRVLQSRAFPGWLHAVERGATTTWERWDAIAADGTFHSPIMNSFNQYTLATVGAWLYETVLGIDVSYAAERPHVRIAPRPGGTLAWARGGVETLAGRVTCAWTLADGELTVEAELPKNVTAVAELPGSPPGGTPLAPGRHVLTAAAHAAGASKNVTA